MFFFSFGSAKKKSHPSKRESIFFLLHIEVKKFSLPLYTSVTGQKKKKKKKEDQKENQGGRGGGGGLERRKIHPDRERQTDRQTDRQTATVHIFLSYFPHRVLGL